MDSWYQRSQSSLGLNIFLAWISNGSVCFTLPLKENHRLENRCVLRHISKMKIKSWAIWAAWHSTEKRGPIMSNYWGERKPNHFQTSLARTISCSGNTKAICFLSFCQQNLYFASKWKVTKLTSPVRKQASTLSTAACTTNDIGKVYLSFMPRIISCTDSLVSA